MIFVLLWHLFFVSFFFLSDGWMIMYHYEILETQRNMHELPRPGSCCSYVSLFVF